MNFVAALKCGTTPEVEASRCIRQLLNRSESHGEICPTLATEFVNELFKAIGLQTSITEQQLQEGKGFDWEGAGCRSYIFHCNTIFFRAFERFLMHLCKVVLGEQQTFHTDCAPIKLLLGLLSIWCNCYTDLLEKQDVDMHVQYLQEPIARINYRLFFGAHKIRRKYGAHFPQSDEICSRLLNSALHGLFFKECHDYIAEGLTLLVEKQFGLSEAFTKDAFTFFYQAFCVEQQKTTHSNLFKCFSRMLNNLAPLPEGNVYRKFLGFLIENQMQEVYYTILKVEKTKRLLMSALRFLNDLQEQLLDLDCFSQTFLEAILALVLHSDESVSELAAELYINMARRKASADDILLKHILEYYFEEMNSVDSLSYYVAAFWPHFNYMKTLRIYFDLIKDENVALAMRYFIAQFIIVVYRKMLADTEKYEAEIMIVFHTLPALLTLLNSQCLKGILLQLYGLTELELIRNRCGQANELLSEFENYFVSEFKNGENLQYPYLLNLFMQFTRFIEETKNFQKLEMCGLYIFIEYEEIERTLQGIEEGKLPNHAQTMKYCNVLQKLCVLLQVKYTVLDNLEYLVRTLSMRLLDKQLLQELATKHQLFIDIYATELLVNACIKLSFNKDLTKTAKKWLAGQIGALETYLIKALTNAEMKTNAQLNRLKTHFICIVNLYCVFHNYAVICNLPLNLRSYHILVETLLAGCLRRKPISAAMMQSANEDNLEVQSKYITQYQRFMFGKFTQLHSSKYVVLPSPAAWKLCLHYGLKNHTFNKELLAFMEALTTYHFKIYPHISAVLVYNLYKQKPPMKIDDIQSVIRSQKSFIDQLPSSLSPSLLCANVVLQVLQLLQESLQKLPPTTGNNRLLALKHLNQFTQNLNVNKDNILPDIQTQAKALRNNMLNTAEQMSLNRYLNDLGVDTKQEETKA